MAATLTWNAATPHHAAGRRMDGNRPLAGLPVAELVARYRAAGDDAVFEELYRRTRRMAFGAALRVLGDAAAAEEICHDAFLRAYDRFASLRGAEFPSWVCRIATNLALNLRRRWALAERAGAESADPPAAPGAEQRLISRQELAIAEEILAELKPEQRRVLLLRHLDGCSHRRIGAETGYSADQVRSYLQNARRNFALRWRQRTGGGGGDDA